MAEAAKYLFSYKEVVISLIKQQNIHEGIWALMVEFGLAAANAGPDDDQMSPAAIVPVQRIGIHRVDKLTNLSVDASIENPATGKTTAKKAIRST